MTFDDHFSAQAAAYAAFRPSYSDELFAYLARLAPCRALAWDCATGNGQAALGLAAHFDRVVATDASATQLAQAKRHPRVAYRVAAAEASGLADTSVDLVTVAQALHWFDINGFYREARRVLVPGGALAVWAYDDVLVDEPALDAIVARYNREVVGPYWPPQRQLLRDGYRTVPFPFREATDVPAFVLERTWTLAELVGYLATWSATVRCAEATGQDPIPIVERALCARWGGDPERRYRVRWPLALRVGWTEAP